LPKILTIRRNDGSVGNDDNFLFELLLKFLNYKRSDLSVETMRSVGDFDEEILGGGTVGSLHLHVLDGVDEDKGKILLLSLVAGLRGGKGLSDILFEIGWLRSVLLNDFISSAEHVFVLLVFKKAS